MTTGTWPTGPPHPQAAGPTAPPTTQVGLTTFATNTWNIHQHLEHTPTPGTYTNWPTLQAAYMLLACMVPKWAAFTSHLVMRAAWPTCDVTCSQSGYVLEFNNAKRDRYIVLAVWFTWWYGVMVNVFEP